MRKNFLQTLLVVVLSVIGVSQCWAANYIEPFSYVGHKTGCCGWQENPSISYDRLNDTYYGTVSRISDATYGEGYYIEVGATAVPDATKSVVMMLTSYTHSVEPYTKVVLTYKYKLSCYDNQGSPARAMAYLYKFDDEAIAKSTEVDFIDDSPYGYGSIYRLANVQATRDGQGGWKSTSEKSTTFEFDNLTGTSAKDISKYLMLVLVERQHINPAQQFLCRGAFRCTSHSFTTTYRKVITFDGNGSTGGSMSQQTIDNSGNLTTNTFARTGYVFTGWNTQADGKGTAYTNGQAITVTASNKGAITLYAQWKRTVTLDAQSGTVTPTSINVNCYSTYSNLPTPTRTGYTFKGWFDAPTGGNQYTTTTASTNVIPAILYAQWTAITYNITYNENGGSKISGPLSYTIETETFALPEPTKEGYTFGGWFTNEACTEGKTTQIVKGSTTGNKEFYAQWTAIDYTITYHENGGSEISGPLSYTIETETFDLPEPTKNGYDFDGWFTDEACTKDKTTQIIQGSIGNKTFYAKWNAIDYTITYHENGGSKIEDHLTYTIETETFDLPVPEKNGYDFGGWFTNEACTQGQTTQILKGSTENKTFYAKWTAITYNITYNVNGGSAITEPKTYTIETATFALPVPTREGYTFGGWFTNEACTAGQTTQIIQGSIGDKEFYAKWSENVVSDGTGKTLTEAQNEVNTALSTWVAECEGSKPINLTINRTIYKDGYYNTLCLPFAMSADQITETFGDYKELKQFQSATVQGSGASRSIVIEVKDATTIEAGKAYLISFEKGTNITTLTFNNVIVTKTAATDESGNLAYQGILAPYQLPYEDQDYLFLGEKNTLYWAINDGTFMKGFRAYFKVNTNPAQTPYRAGMRAAFGGHQTPTDLSPVVSGQEVRKLLEQGRVVIVNKGVKYNMNGATVQ